MKNKEIPEETLDRLVDKAIISEAEQDNLELGHALKNLSTEELDRILKCRRPNTVCMERSDTVGMDRPETVCMEERVETNRKRRGWKVMLATSTLAAVLAGAFIINRHTSAVARQEGTETGKCEALYAYNVSEFPDVDLFDSYRGGGMEKIPDIRHLSAERLATEINGLKKQFDDASTLQETALYGRVLVMVCLKAHDARTAVTVLETMKVRLGVEAEDYEETIEWCNQLLECLK